MNTLNRQWLLADRPAGPVSATDFEYREGPVPEPELDAGEVLVRNLYLGFDPTQREWIKDQQGYMPPVALGEPMRSFAVAQVLKSRNPQLPEGALVQGMFGWQDYALTGPNDPVPPVRLPEGLPPSLALSALGATTLTAYFGLLDVAALKPDDTVVISAAAGATGSAAVQIAKHQGCRVIGIAGGAEKCRRVCETFGADGAIDYRSEDLGQRLAELCPAGIDVYFDNVGGPILETAIDHIAPRGRIVLCGQISGYDAPEPPPGPRNLMRLIYQRARMEGFLMLDYLDRIPEAMQTVGGWLAEGSFHWREDIQEGFENIPATLARLFSGENQGKQLLKLADPV